MDQMMQGGGMCGCGCHKTRKWVSGLGLIVIGVLVLLRAFAVVALSWEVILGIFIVLWGVKALTRGMCGCNKMHGREMK